MSDARLIAPWRYVMPNLLTALNLSLGFFAVLLAVEGRFEAACWMVVWCVLLDKADGAVARLLRAQTSFGGQFDSFADMVAFGFAPAMIAYHLAHQHFAAAFSSWLQLSFGAAVLLFVLCAALRLARFNCLGHQAGVRYFEGVPTTFSGAIIATTLLVYLRHGLPAATLMYLPGLLLLLSLGLVSSLPVPKLLPRPNRVHNYAQLVLIALTYIAGAGMLLPEYLLGLAVAYIVIGTSHAWWKVPAERRFGAGGGDTNAAP